MIALMYHDIEDGNVSNEKRGTPPYHYVISADTLRQHLELIASLNLKVVTLSQFLARSADESIDPARAIILTFDDGHESVERVAMPILASYGFAGTTQVVAGFVGKPNAYTLDRKQLRNLRDSGWDIGSHGLDHVVLTELDNQALHRELVESKEILEAALDETVPMISIPHGPYDRRVRKAIVDAGYTAAFCSTPGINRVGMDPLAIRRMTVTRSIGLDAFQNIVTCNPGFYAKETTRRFVYSAAQTLLGSRLYGYLRAKALTVDASERLND